VSKIKKTKVNILIMVEDESNNILQRIALSSSNSNRTQLGTERLDCAKKPETKYSNKRWSPLSASYDNYVTSAAAPEKAAITPWTTAKMIDELILELARVNIYVKNQEDGFVRIIPKYYSQAQELMYRIPLYKPDPPYFEMDLKDLSCQLKNQLANIKKSDRTMFEYVRKMAITHIFENIQFAYTHISVCIISGSDL
jgi:hypothetical protein